MDFLKKARGQVKGAVQEAQGLYNQYKPQQQGYVPQGPNLYQNHQTGPYQAQTHQQQQYHNNYSHQNDFQQQHHYTQPNTDHQVYSQQFAHDRHQSPMPLASYSSQQSYPPYSNQQVPNQYNVAQTSPPQSQPFNMHSLHQSLPDVHQKPDSRNFARPADQTRSHLPPVSNTQVQPHTSYVPLASSMAQNTVACPRYEAALIDEVQFYVFQSRVLSQVQPALETDNFAVCSSCFSQHFAAHPNIAGNFELRQRTESHILAPEASFEKLMCDFALPTVRQIFYKDCVSRGSIAPLLEFAKHAVTLPACEGAIIEQPTAYYESRKGDRFAVCKTCFEWYLRGTVFERDLSWHTPDDGWVCDIGARGYLFRAFIGELQDHRPDFNRFATKSKQRNALPPCPGVGNAIAPADSSGPHYTYEAVNDKAGVFCQACFYDKVLGTSMEPCFNVYNQLEMQYYGNIACDLASVPSTFAMEAAIRAGDDEIWRRCMTGRETIPKCIGLEGVDEELLQGQVTNTNQWYYYADGPRIEVCPMCYCSTVQLLGAASLFSPITRAPQPGVVRMCYLAVSENLNADTTNSNNFENTLVWRGTMLRRWLHQGYDKHGDFSALKNVAKAIAGWPRPCISDKRAIKPACGRKWYGNHFLAEGDETKTGIAVCEECFDHYIRATPLESFAGHDLTEKINKNNPSGFVCNTSSRRARDELGAACEKGDFLIFARYFAARKDCEARFKAMNVRCQQQADKQKSENVVLDMQNQMAAIRLMGQLTANTNATIMGIGGSVAEAAAPDYGQRYGNSTVGYGYLTSAGANAAQAHANAANMSRQGVSVADFHPSGNTWQDTQNLLALSKAMTAEWDAIR